MSVVLENILTGIFSDKVKNKNTMKLNKNTIK